MQPSESSLPSGAPAASPQKDPFNLRPSPESARETAPESVETKHQVHLSSSRPSDFAAEHNSCSGGYLTSLSEVDNGGRATAAVEGDSEVSGPATDTPYNHMRHVDASLVVPLSLRGNSAQSNYSV